MTSILDQLDQDHGNVSRLLDVMEVEQRKLARGDHCDIPLLVTIMRYLTEYQDVFHHPREDLLFTRIRVRSPGATDEITDLESQHHSLGAQGAHLYGALAGQQDEHQAAIAENLATYIDLLREHMRREARRIFPLARIILSRSDWDSVNAKFRSATDPLFGPAVEQSYRLVFERMGENQSSPIELQRQDHTCA